MLLNLRILLAIWIGKACMIASRILGRGGSTLPGRVALKVEPRLMGMLAGRVGCCILVSGTNGKTTTASIIAGILRQNGERVIHNASGANLVPGVTSALVAACDWWGHTKSNWAVLEVDEATVPLVLREVRVEVAVVTNFFRDQLDRYGEIEHTVSLVRQGLEYLPRDARVILNADDPLVASLGEGLECSVQYYGLDCPEMASREGAHASDIKHCKACDTPYQYQGYYYAHLGIYRCPGCGRERPCPSVRAERVVPAGTLGTSILLDLPGYREEVFVKVPGLYNVYNALAAGTAVWTLGIAPDLIKSGIEGFSAAFGRMEEVLIRDRRVFLALAKNPTGFNEVLRTISQDEGAKRLLVAINDNIADGRDVSWLWDVDFEVVAENGALVFALVSGIRAEDMAVRLKYAGVDPSRIRCDQDVCAALDQALDMTPEGEVLYVLPTYTAMLGLRRRLVQRGLVRPW